VRLRLFLRRTVVLFSLGRVLPFLLLFLRQESLLFRVFLPQLLRLLLMLLLDLLFFSLLRLLLREFRVFLLLLLLESLPVLLLFRAELILLLLVLPVQPGIRGGLDNGPWRSRNLVRMGCRRRSRPIGSGGWLRSVVRVRRAFRRAVNRAIGGLCSVRRYRPVCRWISIIGWYGPVGGTVWWPRSLRRHCLRSIIRWDRPIGLCWWSSVVRVRRAFRRAVNRTIGGLHSRVTSIRRHLHGLRVLRLTTLGLAGPVRL
jgi:hypothetical protein